MKVGCRGKVEGKIYRGGAGKRHADNLGRKKRFCFSAQGEIHGDNQRKQSEQNKGRDCVQRETIENSSMSVHS